MTNDLKNIGGKHIRLSVSVDSCIAEGNWIAKDRAASFSTSLLRIRS